MDEAELDELALPEEEEWVDVTPTMTTKDVVVVCSTCGAVNPRRSHFPKGEFSTECPKCRRKAQMREVQKRRYWARKLQLQDAAKELDRREKARWRATAGRLDVLISAFDAKQARYDKIRLQQPLNPKQEERYRRNAETLIQLHMIRKRIVRDLEAHCEQPFHYYLELFHGSNTRRTGEEED